MENRVGEMEKCRWIPETEVLFTSINKSCSVLTIPFLLQCLTNARHIMFKSTLMIPDNVTYIWN
jgi:hypothetical protein